jgi:sugar O-acyltransferase (sialic acid O-acetyltransferase NeuD family)
MLESRFCIFGSGGFGRELIPLAKEHLASRRAMGKPSQQLVFVTDNPLGATLGIPEIAAGMLREQDEVIVAIGDSQTRRQIVERLGARYGVLRSTSTIIGPGVEVGEGSVFCAFTMVTASARVGRHFQCNIYSYVAHDCIVGDYVTFAPRVSCNGNVHIADGVYVGTGAVIRPGSADRPLTIGENAIIGMGAVVTKDVPAGVTVVGNPAKTLVRGEI